MQWWWRLTLVIRSSSGYALRRSVCLLVFQMGHVNPMLKGTATLQVCCSLHYQEEDFECADKTWA